MSIFSEQARPTRESGETDEGAKNGGKQATDAKKRENEKERIRLVRYCYRHLDHAWMILRTFTGILTRDSM